MINSIITPRHDEPIRPGAHVWSWCSKHMGRTEHKWDGHILICLECHPEPETGIKLADATLR
jgi:hypothetical protein